MFLKSPDNDHMCEHQNVMECSGPGQVTQTPRRDSLCSKQFVLFSKLFSVLQSSKTKHLTGQGVCWSKTLVHSLSRYANFPFLLSIIIPI